MRDALDLLGQLLGLQVGFGVLAHLAFDLRPAAVVVSLAYLALVAGSARSWRAERGRLRTPGRRALAAAGAAGLLWQLPALGGSLNLALELLGLTPYNGNSDLLDFAMQTWHTPLMPLLALIPPSPGFRFAPYYPGLALAGPCLVLGVILLAAGGARRKRAHGGPGPCTHWDPQEVVGGPAPPNSGPPGG